MTLRVLAVFCLTLAAFGVRGEGGADTFLPVAVATADAVPVSEAEAQEEEATDPPIQTPDSDRRAADVPSAPSAGDWRPGPEVRPPRR